VTRSVETETPAVRRKLFLLKISHSTAKQFVHLYNSCTEQSLKASRVTVFNMVVTFHQMLLTFLKSYTLKTVFTLGNGEVGWHEVRWVRWVAVHHTVMCKEALHNHGRRSQMLFWNSSWRIWWITSQLIISFKVIWWFSTMGLWRLCVTPWHNLPFLDFVHCLNFTKHYVLEASFFAWRQKQSQLLKYCFF